jgi:hypothetical protein
MSALAFWRAVVEDHSNFLGRVIEMLNERGIRYCVIGGVGVNAYAEAVVTLDLDIVLAADDLERARTALEAEFRVREFEHSLNVYDPGSKLQVQIQLDPALSAYVERAEVRDVLGLPLPVASPADLMASKVAAAMEPRRRPSKRQKDLADVARLLDVHPELAADLPEEIKSRLIR